MKLDEDMFALDVVNGNIDELLIYPQFVIVIRGMLHNCVHH